MYPGFEGLASSTDAYYETMNLEIQQISSKAVRCEFSGDIATIVGFLSFRSLTLDRYDVLELSPSEHD